ncbi:(2Fe-2S)-binding protein [Actinokineospora bangkokensis]|uniref:(2Fe-2S)-binding protein n=1 Tax=Actinokineospora bangkokensis TaxID=1193682 RepID=A0A1Q9LSM1_9PSEU|nr:2Fe-2S iron-sulfur cluster-binding protein [Actinokineospora bangkokensis]OLR95036.1 (2Fe-2S)-binding protein [Actinokineospora bangkokensis]
MDVDIELRVDGRERSVTVDTRTTLLDALRDRLGTASAKKGCDQGQCGACTVLLDGRRVVSCLVLAVAHDGAEVTTSAGLAAGGRPHPLHTAFVDHDALQCGFCTPGQVCSAAGALAEVRAGWPSAVTPDGATPVLSDDEVRERMSGNLCRCGAHRGIVAAIREVGA